MSKTIDFFRATLRPRLGCEDCSWVPSTVQGDGYVLDLNEARLRASDHLKDNPYHHVVADQVTVTTYYRREKS